MPGPQDLPAGGIADAKPAQGVDVERELAEAAERNDEDDDPDPAQAAVVEGAAYFPPGQPVS